MDEVRTFVEVMAVVKEGDYRDRGTTMTDDIVAMAEQKQLYLVQFCQREAIRIKL
ncbi:hypothetical protein HYY70_05275 [Candidatus Woesearchaeota archaeon]|nr:hypothetical protein [Candidatus Woesearchaeota archaeon]